VLAPTCERIAVMYAGRIVEEGPAAATFEAPAHPYTRALAEAFPTIGELPQQVRAHPPRRGRASCRLLPD
jgi:ABC-type dipeptide/oligopeptide/nickel transport system ATPase component